MTASTIGASVRIASRNRLSAEGVARSIPVFGAFGKRVCGVFSEARDDFGLEACSEAPKIEELKLANGCKIAAENGISEAEAVFRRFVTASDGIGQKM